MKLDELKRIKQEAMGRKAGDKILVSMGTCSLAVGAGETMRAVKEALKEHGLQGVRAIPTGCVGLCHREPLVQVVKGDERVTYGQVSPERARRIVAEHLVKGRPIEEWLVA